MSKLIDLSGERFNKLIAIKLVGQNRWGNYRWLCQCDCGEKIIVCGSSLKSGNTKSCGCLLIKHGYMIKSKALKIYQIWQQIKQRCTNPNNKYYKDYGGRGIKVCRRWRNSFPNFLENMPGWKFGLQIDRIDNDGNYYKENCRWVTPKQNSNNRRDNIFITYNGKTQLLIKWSKEIGIPYITLWQRIFKYGWPIQKALVITKENDGKNNG